MRVVALVHHRPGRGMSLLERLRGELALRGVEAPLCTYEDALAGRCPEARVYAVLSLMRGGHLRSVAARLGPGRVRGPIPLRVTAGVVARAVLGLLERGGARGVALLYHESKTARDEQRLDAEALRIMVAGALARAGLPVPVEALSLQEARSRGLPRGFLGVLATLSPSRYHAALGPRVVGAPVLGDELGFRGVLEWILSLLPPPGPRGF